MTDAETTRIKAAYERSGNKWEEASTEHVQYWYASGWHAHRDTVEPRINIKCVTPDGIGSTSLPVIRVEQEDDGSLTAVTDYWPP